LYEQGSDPSVERLRFLVRRRELVREIESLLRAGPPPEARERLIILIQMRRSLQLVEAAIEEQFAARESARHVPVNTTGQILLLVLMWLVIMTVPVAIQESKLPAEIQQTLDDYYGLLAGLAVSITFVIAPKLMKKATKK
jgi:hypothetical protein